MKKIARLSMCLFLLTACGGAPRPTAAGPVVLIYVQADPAGAPELVRQAPGVAAREILPLALPAECGVYNLAAAGHQLAVELACGGGPAVVLLDLASGAASYPVRDRDSRLLAWSPDGAFLYLQTDTYGDGTVVRVATGSGRLTELSLPAGTYDLAVLPDGDLLYSLTRGIGFGSEVYRADARGGNARLVLSQPGDIVAYLRPSPDGSQVAYILIPDTQVPFSVGGLWLMDAGGGDPRFLAEADAGHGYAPAWSPEGDRIAFVVRANPADAQADLTPGALRSNLHLYDLRDGSLRALTDLADAVVETPAWAPDDSALAFNVIIDGTIHVWVYDTATGTLRQVGETPSCCAVWATGR
ncbi:MAG: PD40 domain-containing protein [Anaerolineales bacterium]|nr:PD40 domain-containing protein [Anaerolineales bacterium]